MYIGISEEMSYASSITVLLIARLDVCNNNSYRLELYFWKTQYWCNTAAN